MEEKKQEKKAFDVWLAESKLSRFQRNAVKGYYAFPIGKLQTQSEFDAAVDKALSARIS